VKLDKAKPALLAMLREDIARAGLDASLTPKARDGDKGKFELNGRPVRVHVTHDGFYLNVGKRWLAGNQDPPEIDKGHFEYYAFVLSRRGVVTHYWLAHYTRVRELALEFDLQLGPEYRTKSRWRAYLHRGEGMSARFRWGNEKVERLPETRNITLNNIREVLHAPTPPLVVVPAPQQYRGFGEAPNDDPEALQRFARKVRKGQHKLRKNLLATYEGRCAITGHGPEAVLQAAHIEPHAQRGLNSLDNGLLLRSDIHDLFDDGLIRIHPETLEIWVDASLQGTPYGKLKGKLRERRDKTYPSRELLRQRWVTAEARMHSSRRPEE
jgi:hypothetical protein